MILATFGIVVCLAFAAFVGAACATLIARLCYLPQSESRLVGWLNGLIALTWVVAFSVMKGIFTSQLLTFFISTSVAIGTVFPLIGVGVGLRVFEKLWTRR